MLLNVMFYLLFLLPQVGSFNSIFNYWQCLGIKSKIDFSKPYGCNVGDLPLIVWKNDKTNKLMTTINVCKHMGSKMDKGKIENGCLKCPYHGLEFSEKDTFGQTMEQDGKIFWAYNPIHKIPHKIPFFSNPLYVNNFLQIDMDCSLIDSAYNTMDIRHPEFVHNNLGFGSNLYPLNINSFKYKDRIGLKFDYLSNDLMRYINNVNHTNNFHMFVVPNFTWSKVSFNKKNLLISVNFLPLEKQKTRWFITITHDYNKDTNGQQILKILASTIISQDYVQLRNQYEENELKKAMILKHTFKDEEAIIMLKELLKNYKYPDIKDSHEIYKHNEACNFFGYKPTNL